MPVEEGDRRYAVFDVLPTHKEDAAYFAAMDAENADGGFEKLMHILMTWPIDDAVARSTPRTDAFVEQQAHGRDVETDWLVNAVLMPGMLPGDKTAEGWTSIAALWDAYIRFAKKRGKHHTRSVDSFGRWLKKQVPGTRREKKKLNGQWRWACVFPALAEARRQFGEVTDQQLDWGDTTGETWAKDLNDGRIDDDPRF